MQQRIGILPLDLETPDEEGLRARKIENFIPVEVPGGITLEVPPSGVEMLPRTDTVAFQVFAGVASQYFIRVSKTQLTVEEPDGSNLTVLASLPSEAEGAHFAILGPRLLVVVHYTDGQHREPYLVGDLGREAGATQMPELLSWGWPELPRISFEVITGDQIAEDEATFLQGTYGFRVCWVNRQGFYGPASRVYRVPVQRDERGFRVRATINSVVSTAGYDIEGLAVLVSEDLNSRGDIGDVTEIPIPELTQILRPPSIIEMMGAAYFHAASIEDLQMGGSVTVGGTAAQIAANPSYEEGLLAPRTLLPQVARSLNGRVMLGDIAYSYPEPDLAANWKDPNGSGFGAAVIPVITGSDQIWQEVTWQDGWVYTATVTAGLTCTLRFDGLPPGINVAWEWSDDNVVWNDGQQDARYRRATLRLDADARHWNTTWTFTVSSVGSTGGRAEQIFTITVGDEPVGVAPEISGDDASIFNDAAGTLYYPVTNSIENAPPIVELLQLPSWATWELEYSPDGSTGWTTSPLETEFTRVKVDWTLVDIQTITGTFVVQIRATNTAGAREKTAIRSFDIVVSDAPAAVIITGPDAPISDPVLWQDITYGHATPGTDDGIRVDLLDSDGLLITAITVVDGYLDDPVTQWPAGTLVQVEYWDITTREWLPDIEPTDRARIRWSPGPDTATSVYKVKVTGTNDVQPTPTEFEMYVEMGEIGAFVLNTNAGGLTTESGSGSVEMGSSPGNT